MYPENYAHPASTLEGKKALLLSISPQLLDSENNRKKEAEYCQGFTRCRVGKNIKNQCIEYTDIDLESVIEESEYERRYLLLMIYFIPFIYIF